MAREPEHRPASAGEFARELAAALETGPEEKTAKTKTRRFGRRRSNAAAVAAPAAGAAAGAAAASPAAAATPPPRAAAAKPPAHAAAAHAAAAPARAADPKPTPRDTPTAPSTASPPYATGGRRRGRERSPLLAIGLAAVFVALAVAIVAGAVLSGGDDEGSSPSSADRTPAQPAKQDRQNEPKAKKEPKKADEAPKEAAPAASAAQEEQPVSYDPARGAALNDEGFRLMNAGAYDEAIAKLQAAVDSFPPGTSDLNYAYALFNLGKSLRLAGRPDEAVPILEQRLKIPNQQDTVQRELDLAKQQAGET
jgi:tetratricopeptide (TPR) repeat protein